MSKILDWFTEKGIVFMFVFIIIVSILLSFLLCTCMEGCNRIIGEGGYYISNVNGDWITLESSFAFYQPFQKSFQVKIGNFKWGRALLKYVTPGSYLIFTWDTKTMEILKLDLPQRARPGGV